MLSRCDFRYVPLSCPPNSNPTALVIKRPGDPDSVLDHFDFLKVEMEPSFHFRLKPGVPEALPYHHTIVPYEHLFEKDLEVHESSSDRKPTCSSCCRG